VATILTVGVVGLLLGLRLGGWEALGLTAAPDGSTRPLDARTHRDGVAIIGLLAPLDRRLGADLPDLLAEFLPRTRSEKGMFVGVSLAAGVGEEIAYRGYAFLALQLLGVGPWVAAGISSVAFGFLHAYQGPVGIVRAGSMGLVFAASVLLTGSLLPAIAAHALIDLVAGLVLGPRLLRPLVDPPPPGSLGDMDLDFGLMADAATVDGSGKLNVLGVFDRIQAREFPARHGRISLVLRFSAGVDEVGSHEVVIRLRAPGGQELLRLDGRMDLEGGAREAGEGIGCPTS
jgi:hypothetical protein